MILVNAGCLRSGTTVGKKDDSKEIPRFSIYLVKEERKNDAIKFSGFKNGSQYKGLNINLDILSIQDTPVITDKDIKAYHWKTHQIEFTEEFISKQSTGNLNSEKKQMSSLDSGSKILKAEEFDAFLIEIDGKRIYSGGFPYSPIRSQIGAAIIIKDKGRNSIEIWHVPDIGNDLRSDMTIYKLFKEQGKLVE